MKKSFGMRRPCSGPWFHIATRWPWASFNFYKPRFQHPSDVNDTNSYLTGNSSGFKRVKAPLRKDSILAKIRVPVSGKCAVMCLVAQSHPTLCKLWSVATRLLCPWGFSRQEHRNGLPCPPPGDLPNPGIKPRSPALQADSSVTREAQNTGGGSLSLLQGNLPTQESNQGLLHSKGIPYQLSYPGSPSGK